MGAVLGIIIASFVGYGKAGLGVSFFPDIEPDQAQVQVLARGDLSAKERDGLVNAAETTILPVSGVQDFYARSFRPVVVAIRRRGILSGPSALSLPNGTSATRRQR